MALTKAGEPHPALVKARVLVDTGASCTVLDPLVISRLGIPSRGAVPIHTPSTSSQPKMFDQYDVGIMIPIGVPLKIFDNVPIVEADLSAQQIQGLLGRDILSLCILIYNGQYGHYTLAF